MSVGESCCVHRCCVRKLMGWLLVAGWCRRRIGVVRLDRRSGSSLAGEDGVRLPCFGGLGGGSIAFFVA